MFVRHAPILETPPDPAGGVNANWCWRDEADCATCAQALAQLMAQDPALRNVSIELQGSLGAGKTTFVRHLLHALGVQGRIKSPTFAVMESYSLPDALGSESASTQASAPRSTDSCVQAAFEISHFDFYRFEEPRDWSDSGFRDVFAAPGLKLVEWPQHAQGLLPVADLAMNIQIQAGDSRLVLAEAGTEAGRCLLRGLAAPARPETRAVQP